MRWMDKIPMCRCLHHCCCHGSKGATVDNGVKDGDCYLYCVNGFVRYMIGGKDSYRYICFERPRRCKTGRLEAPMRLSKHEFSKERESDATVAIGRYMVHHCRGMTHRDPSTRSLPNTYLLERPYAIMRIFYHHRTIHHGTWPDDSAPIHLITLS